MRDMNGHANRNDNGGVQGEATPTVGAPIALRKVPPH